jgi:hypothetical protein
MFGLVLSFWSQHLALAGDFDDFSMVEADEVLVDAPADHVACAGDLAVQACVEGLLLAHERAGGFLSDPVATAERLFPIGELSAGARVGKFTLLRVIGERGCGTVYEAGEDAPLRRRVALKVIKAGMDTRQVVARFGREREALAMMEHPNIARVLDAGAPISHFNSIFPSANVNGPALTDISNTVGSISLPSQL